MGELLDVIREAAADAGLASSIDERGLHVFEAEGDSFRLRAEVEDGNFLGLSFRVTGEGCRPLRYDQDNDLYAVTGPKFGPIALEIAEELAAFIRAFAARRVLVGCRSGGMVFTSRSRRTGCTRGRDGSSRPRSGSRSTAQRTSSRTSCRSGLAGDGFARYVKVRLRLEQDEDGYPPSCAERVWAVPARPGRSRLDNIPWYAPGVAVGDVVEARDQGEGVRVVERSGHSTLRVFDAEETQALRHGLRALGCDSELSHPPLISVDVPADVDVGPVLDLLLRGREQKRWDLETGHVGDPHVDAFEGRP